MLGRRTSHAPDGTQPDALRSLPFTVKQRTFHQTRRHSDGTSGLR